MPVLADRLERRMRGGAQAFLLHCSDGFSYIVKTRENPQHRRILINEWLSHVFLRYLQITAPEVRVVEITAEFAAREADLCLHTANQRIPVKPGRHFGSRYPGNPLTDAAYDYLPDKLLGEVVNLHEFAGVLVFDKWVSNADSRQAVFCRRRLADIWGTQSGYGNRKGFAALMVDHGYAFDGPHWQFGDAPLQGAYFKELAYRGVRGMDDFSPWLDRLASMPYEVFDTALASVPREWFDGDEAEMERLLEQLWRRRDRVADLVLACVRSKPRLFPDWRQ